jgi:hypothetical protein
MDQRQAYELSQGLSDTTEGVVLSIDWGSNLVEVNLNGITMRMPWSGPAPWPADRVRVVMAGQKRFCQLIQGAPMGTVSTTASGYATATGDDGVVYKYRYLGSAPANGARVRLDHAGRVAIGTYSGEPAGSTFIPAPQPPPPSGDRAWFSPAWSGNWWFGSFASELVESSYNRVAAYGYGTSIADSIPDGATIGRAEWHLALNWDNVPQNNATAGIHGHNARPGNLPESDLTGSISVPTGSRAIDIRGAIADALKTGAALGIGFYSDPTWWRQYGAAPGSGRIYMEWS